MSRELRVEAHRLQAWRDEFVASGVEGLKGKPLAPEDRRLKEAERKIGELTMETEVLRAGVSREEHEALVRELHEKEQALAQLTVEYMLLKKTVHPAKPGNALMIFRKKYSSSR